MIIPQNSTNTTYQDLVYGKAKPIILSRKIKNY